VIKFGQTYLSRASITESDGAVSAVFPQEARLRNLTYVRGLKNCICNLAKHLLTFRYSAPLYVDMTQQILVPDFDNPGPNGEPGWKPENPDDPVKAVPSVWLGKVIPMRVLSISDVRLTNPSYRCPSWSDPCSAPSKISKIASCSR
jgi:DNA-directed RNA polymerase II subunit RPB2